MSESEKFSTRIEKIISELIGMMGDKIYYGALVGAPAPYNMCGDMVYENPEDYLIEEAVNALQKILDGNLEIKLPEKSADEMFRELGYNPEGSCRYIKPIRVDNNGLWTYTEIIIDEDEIIKQTQVEPERSVYYEYLSAKEVLACAQLIREMEESKNE